VVFLLSPEESDTVMDFFTTEITTAIGGVKWIVEHIHGIDSYITLTDCLENLISTGMLECLFAVLKIKIKGDQL
jgi:hypothetical protein